MKIFAKNLPPPSLWRHRRKRAFTLLEVIIAIALSAILLASVCGVAVNIMTLWRRSDSISSLERHAAGLNRFLNRLIDAQLTTQIATSEDNASIVGCQWTQPPDNDDYYPSLTIKDSFPILRVGEFPMPTTTAWLFWDRAGLWLITQTPRQLADSDSSCNYTLLTPLLESAQIQVWDSDKEDWENVDSMEESDMQSNAIRLVLRLRKEKRERELVLTLSKTLAGGMSY